MRPRLLVLASAVVLSGCAPALSTQMGSAYSAHRMTAHSMTAATLRPALLRARIGDVRPRAVAPEPKSRLALIESALHELSPSVHEQSHPDALRYAFQAYYNYRASHRQQVRNPYLYFVDYGLGSSTPRGYVFDMESLHVVDGPFTVAHGRGSAATSEGVPVRFSNTPGSYSTSLGLYLAQETYTFNGTAGGQRYRSVGLRLRGLSGHFNDAARARKVVAHGAPYVTPDRAGRSEGCPAMEQHRARRLLPMIANGGLVFLFSPRDPSWLAADPWLAGRAGGVVLAN